MTIDEFIKARVAEDRALAHEAFDDMPGEDDWCVQYTYSAIRHVQRNCDIECSEHPDDISECGRFGRYAGPHVANWDPKRVLAECDMKLAILAAEGGRHVPRKDVQQPIETEMKVWTREDAAVVSFRMAFEGTWEELS